MINVTRVVTVVGIDHVEPEFDKLDFLILLTHVNPQGRSNHFDGKPLSCSWYHNSGGKYYCTTVFESDRLLDGETERKVWSTPEIEKLVAVGSYQGEPGKWYLRKQKLAPKAPYEV